MKHKLGLLGSAFAGMLLMASAAEASLLSVQITYIEQGGIGDTQADLFNIQNLSDGGVDITNVALDFSTAVAGGGAVFFDTVAAAPGSANNFLFAPVGPNPAVGFPGFGIAQAALDGAQFLAMPFTDFNAAEAFNFIGDLDDLDAFVSGFNVLGTSASVTFLRGRRLIHSGRLFRRRGGLLRAVDDQRPGAGARDLAAFASGLGPRNGWPTCPPALPRRLTCSSGTNSLIRQLLVRGVRIE